MKDLRKQIEDVDAQLLRLLGKRMNLVREIFAVKKQSGIPLIDKNREAELRKNLAALAQKEGLDTGLVDRLYDFVLNESRRIQEESA